jgi:hypothetical protein
MRRLIKGSEAQMSQIQILAELIDMTAGLPENSISAHHCILRYIEALPGSAKATNRAI